MPFTIRPTSNMATKGISIWRPTRGLITARSMARATAMLNRTTRVMAAHMGRPMSVSSHQAKKAIIIMMLPCAMLNTLVALQITTTPRAMRA